MNDNTKFLKSLLKSLEQAEQGNTKPYVFSKE